MGTRVEQSPDRAVRFPVHLPVLYRDPETREWVEARTENVSRTGVLFGTAHQLEPDTNVDVRLEVPLNKGDKSHAEVVCKCQVVRVEQASADRLAPAVAVQIRNYRFTRKRHSKRTN
jgi:hypothetical protein